MENLPVKTIIIPDLHQPAQRVLDRIEVMLGDERPDQIVFLGDYFDQFSDTPEDARRTADWLAQSLGDPRRIHLIGNHDAAYFWPGDATFCPGFTDEKLVVIENVLGPNPGDRFRFHVMVDGWLLTHAGLASTWLPKTVAASGIADWLANEARLAREAFTLGRSHWFAEVGRRRGGDHPAGGILWCDWKELYPIEGIKQIVGHTPAHDPRWAAGKTQLCIDTAMGERPTCYAVISGGTVQVKIIRAADPEHFYG